jgi:cardiolipin synthase
MLEALQEARSSIHFQTYIIRPDRIGRRFMDLLSLKARQGVQVRFLYDRLGSSTAHLSGFFLEYLEVPNLQVHGYALIHPLKRRLQINLRNHRKLLVVDGRIGFLGGINIHDQNISTVSKGLEIHDTHFEVQGPAVSELQYSFLQDWYHTSEEHPEALLREEYFPRLEPCGEDFARVVRSGPGHDYEAIHRAFFTFLVMAQRSIRLLTPYFVPDSPLLTALVNAAARGVDVRIIVPKKNNHWYIHYATRSFFSPLLRAGVRIFERPPPFLHAKALLVDNRWAFVGSANFDIRSFQLNFELNLEARGPFAEVQLRQALQEEVLCSEEVELTDFERRKPWKPMLENLCALASPLL